jgi:hypothetical protein
MRRPICPDISEYFEILSFLQDFYLINKDIHKNFSYRYLAKKLNWSAPYLNDVFRGRKKLSLKRALEFIDYIGLKGVKAEKFLFMFLSNTDLNFSKSTLSSNAIDARNTKKQLSNLMREEFESFETIYDFYIIFYIATNKDIWNSSDFLNRLTLNKKITLEKTDQAYDRLIAKGFIKYEPKTGKTIILKIDGLFFDEQLSQRPVENDKIKSALILNSEREFIGNYLNYLEKPSAKDRAFFSGIIHIEEGMLGEALDRIYSLRNYMYSLNEKTDANLANAQNLKVMQFSLNMFSLFKD